MTNSVSFNQIVLAGVIIGLLACPIALAAVIHVPSEAGTVQAGIDSAADGDTVLVASGIYSGAGNEAIRFLGKKIVVKSESGPEATILRTLDTVRTVIFDQAEDSNAVLDGFTISGGYETDFDWSSPYRGGIASFNASPLIKNCSISRCYGNYAGGIDVSGGRPIIRSCVISDNYATWSGGGITAIYDSINIENCRIENNSVSGVVNGQAGFGGGIYDYSGYITIKGCYVGGNRVGIFDSLDAGDGYNFGGGICLEDGVAIIDSVIVAHNSSAKGGGIYAFLHPSDQLTITNSVIYNNTAAHLAGLVCDLQDNIAAAPVHIAGCTFACNYAAQISGDGVAIEYNYAKSSGIPDYHPKYVDYVANDTATQSGMITIKNNIFAFASSTPIYSVVGTDHFDISHNNIWGTVSGPNYGGTLADQAGQNGNISTDPLFCEISDTGFTLDQSSPCLQAGEGGIHMGFRGAGCDMYDGSMPRTHSITLDKSGYENQGILNSVMSIVRPWDTLRISYEMKKTQITRLVVNTPLYVIGPQIGDSASLYSDHGPSDPTTITVDLRSFCVFRRFQVRAFGLTSNINYHSTAIRCSEGSPIIMDCITYTDDWYGWLDNVGISCVDGSPLVRNCAPFSLGTSFEVSGTRDVVASYCCWGVLELDDIELRIRDGFDISNVGYVMCYPFLYELPTYVTYDQNPQPSRIIVLDQNFPNPFNGVTAISYELPAHAHVTLIIYNLLGQTVKRLVDADRPAGTYDVVWDGTDSRGQMVSSGIYFYRLNTGSAALCRKMVLLK